MISYVKDTEIFNNISVNIYMLLAPDRLRNPTFIKNVRNDSWAIEKKVLTLSTGPVKRLTRQFSKTEVKQMGKRLV